MDKHESNETGEINERVYASQRLRETDGASERGNGVRCLGNISNIKESVWPDF